ncbi:MAG: fasciclin domain-containing protein, partial [Cyclobacteriaceae bacterium]
LLYHVISGEIESSELVTGNQATLNSGETVAIDAENLTVNGISIVTPFDVSASNGIIHTIDGVLMPQSTQPTVVEAATDNGLTVLIDALTRAELSNSLLTAAEITVFAPSNEAFTDLLDDMDVENLDELTTKIGGLDNLRKVLQFHVVPAIAFAEDLAEGDQMFTTLAGEMLTVNKSGTTVTVTDVANNTYTVTTADVAIRNGVVHVIDGVVLPTIENPNVVDAANSAGLTTLVSAVTTADLAGALTDAEMITVFAPDNAAFAEVLTAYGVSTLDELVAELGGVANLSKILQFHVVPAIAFSFDLEEGETKLNTLAGEELTINKSGAMITVTDAAENTFSVTGADVAIANGVVHVISGVLLPTLELPDLVTAATSAGLTTLLDAVTKANLATALTDATEITVFAPTNDAFGDLLDRYDAEDLDELIVLLGAETVANVLKFHVIPSQAFSHDIPDGTQTFVTMEGQSVSVTKANGTITLTDYLNFTYTVATPDLAIENGVVHVIDGVLLPDVSEEDNVVEAATSAGLTTLIAALTATDLVDPLLQATEITVFAPGNQAFQNLLDAQEVDDLDGLITKLGMSTVAKVLQFHVVPAVAFAADLDTGEQVLTTLAGETLTVTKTGSIVTVTDKAGSVYTVSTADVAIENGVVHVIDGVLLPSL